MKSYDRGVITLAYGLPKYIEMAKTLARSLLINSPHVKRAIVTDCLFDKEIIKLFDIVIPFNEKYGSNVRQKFYLDKYSPYEKTIFIDSDCIVASDINFIFQDLDGKKFTVPGENYLTSGKNDPFVDIDRILKKFNITMLPKFNGGLYYFERSEISTKLFETARELLGNSKELGFYDFRGDGPADEPIIALAMTLHGQEMFQDNGRMMRTPIGLKGPFDIDVLTGKRSFQKDDKVVSPAVIHFASEWNEHPVYYRETSNLKAINGNGADSKRLILFHKIQLKFGYQIALSRFLLKRIINNPKYVIHLFKKVLSRLFKSEDLTCNRNG